MPFLTTREYFILRAYPNQELRKEYLAAPNAKRRALLVAVDALPKQIAYLKSGHVQVLLAQDCYGWGHKSVEVLLEKIVNGKDPSEKRMIDPLARVTKENADEWSKNWDKWLGKTK